jgi:hypothetical protein
VIKELVIDVVVVAFLGLIFAGALHMHSGKCAHPEEHSVSFSASAHGR